MRAAQTSRRTYTGSPIVQEIHRESRSAAETLDVALRIGIGATLVFGPLAFGGVEEWARLTLECAASILLLLWACRQAVSGELTIRWSPLFVPAFGLLLLVAAQLVSGRTAYWYETQTHALISLGYVMVAFVALQVFPRERDLTWLLQALGVLGFLLAIFAVLQDLSWNGRIYWLRLVPPDVSAYGPYVNHNHYAGLMEMLVPIPIVFALSRRMDTGKRSLFAFAAIVMAASILLSQSRGGVLALFAELVFLATCTAWIRKSRGMLGAALVLLACVMGMAFFVGIDPLLARFLSTRTHLEAELHRWYMVKDSVPMFAQHPWFGWGFGTFATVYPHFRTFYTNDFVNQAHNDYVQVLVELGIAGFACVLALLGMVFHAGLRNIRQRSRDHDHTAALAMLTGIVGILVHSFLDYNLQIPANAMLFYALCALVSVPPVRTVSWARRYPAQL